MAWTEHAERSLFRQHFSGDCWPHELTMAPLVDSEMLARFDCSCGGQAWAAYHPALDQGATATQLKQFVEGLVNSG